MSKKLIVYLLLMITVFIFIGCMNETKTPEIFIDPNDPTIVQDGDTFQPGSNLKFSWTDRAGNPLQCHFTLKKNGKMIHHEKGITELELIIEEEGSYTAEITPEDQRSSMSLSFKVNKLYGELYQSDNGLFFKDDVSDFLEEVYHNTSKKTVGIKFSRLAQSTVTNENPEIINSLVPLSLIDTDDDGIPDQFVNATDKQDPLIIPVAISTQYGTAVYSQILYSEDAIQATRFQLVEGEMAGYEIRFPNPKSLAKTGLKLNRPYSRTLFRDPEDDEKDMDSHVIELRERYDSNTKPLFKLIEKPDEAEKRLADFAIDVSASNVDAFGSYYDTRYMQVAMAFPGNLCVKSVELGNFFKNKQEIAYYRVIEKGGKKILFLFRGITGDEDETDEVTESFATVFFNGISTRGSGEVKFSFDATAYSHRPLYRDVENRYVDGFVFDKEPLHVEW